MADDKGEKQNGISFSFSKKFSGPKLVQINKEYAEYSNETESGKDFIYSAEGKILQSAKPKEGVKELVIPCRSRSDVFASKIRGSDGSTLDKEAAEEIIKDLTSAERDDHDGGNNFAIPLLARTHLASSGETTNNTETSTLNTESTLEDYDAVPVMEFGAAMLRGMGWKKGEAIGGTNKGLTVPIEFIPRSQGLGLGAERKTEEPGKRRKRKPGDPKSTEHSGPIIEKNGKVRHFKGLDEEVSDHSRQVKSFARGGYVVIESGPHKELSGKITVVDEDNARIFVRLAINSEEVTVSQHNVRLVDREEYKKYSYVNTLQNTEAHYKTTKRHREVEKRESGVENRSKKQKLKYQKRVKDGDVADDKGHSCTMDTSTNHPAVCWMAPLIRVRIISKSFKNGKYYQKKVIIQDVSSRTSCVCKTDDNKLLEGNSLEFYGDVRLLGPSSCEKLQSMIHAVHSIDVPQSVLETVIPKNEPRHVLFVQGKHKGLVGEIVQRESSKQQAVIQILRDKSIVKSHFDDISEYTGDVDRMEGDYRFSG